MTTINSAYFLAISISLLASLLITPLVIRISSYFKILDKPDLANRKIHKKATPLLGGWAIFLSVFIFTQAYFAYFINWANNPNIRPAFSYNDYVIGNQLNQLPDSLPKYVVVKDTDRKIERDYPISLQTILFVTDSFTEQKRKEKNLYYLTPEEFKTDKLLENSFILEL